MVNIYICPRSFYLKVRNNLKQENVYSLFSLFVEKKWLLFFFEMDCMISLTHAGREQPLEDGGHFGAGAWMQQPLPTQQSDGVSRMIIHQLPE